MNIRKTTKEDLHSLISLFDEARNTIKALHIDQWQDGYPQKDVLLSDIEKGESYVLEEDGTIQGSFVLLTRKEKNYDSIAEGNWKTENEEYVTLHRVAVFLQYRGKGLSEQMLSFAEKEAKKEGKTSIRIDTHRGNTVMRKMLERNGFSYCGVIFLESGAERVAYERII